MSINYYEIEDVLKTGDLIFFSGRGIIPSCIRFFTGCDYSHVGMVLELELHGKRVLVIFEASGCSYIIDYRSANFKSGVTLINLTTKLHTYTGTFGVKRLNKRLTEDHKAKLYTVINKLRDTDYTKNLYALLVSVFKLKPVNSGMYTMVCSELIAVILQRLNLLDNEIPAEWYNPYELTLITKMQEGYEYGEIEPISLYPNVEVLKIL
ncbi:permuted papain-like amidase [Paraglaciecola Antarctic GD virus 1]|nr:permuted papain-like amidase [Paraglaciecola Antarctic GD virus 1]